MQKKMLLIFKIRALILLISLILFTGCQDFSLMSYKDWQANNKTAAVIPTNGLVCELLLNGNTNDTSGYNNPMTPNNIKSTIDRFGLLNGAYDFDGTTSTIDAANNLTISNPGSFTVCVWVMPKNLSGVFILDRVPFSNSLIDITIDTTGKYTYQTRYEDASGLTQITGAGAEAEIGRWAFITIIRDYPNQFKLYVNAMLIATSPDNNGEQIVAYPIRIGQYQAGSGGFIGSICDFRAYNRALSDDEINALYHEKSNGLVN